jgi:hypothetical protein
VRARYEVPPDPMRAGNQRGGEGIKAEPEALGLRVQTL